VGTATFRNALAMIEVIEGLAKFCAARGIARVAELTGAVKIAYEPPQLGDMS
jgi:dihydroorotate dehydrogenase (NAD+) catalytic subunit